ncbi:MAG: NADPH-dependent glutamate synthase [Firmicutes bacterium]|nr:NADPH-dependent glutamate synthase [Bacillota bacterium]
MPLKLTKTPIPAQKPEERIHNFNEVALGYAEEQALEEAARCLHCKNAPCKQGCPVEVDIPEFITHIKNKDYASAIETIKAKNNLPAICGRVCPQENQCEKFCTLGKKGEPVGIGRLERFAADYDLASGRTHTPELPESTGFKVAVIGSGPAGLTAAADLARMGHQVTIFEALHLPGGVLMYGIPEFRLPKRVVQKEIDYVRQLGVEIKPNFVIGKTATVDELFEHGFDAVFISTGAGLPHFMGIPGENLLNIYSANEFLTRTNLMKAYLFPEYATPIKVGERVAVIGGGNVAMDSARTALRLGAKEVSIIYRRSREELPARKEETEHAEEEGVKFQFLTSPVQYTGDEQGHVTTMTCLRYELGEPDASGRRRPIAIPGSEFDIPVDTVVVAIGQGPNPLVLRTTPGLELTKKGTIKADENTGTTSRPGVFAGGDIVTGAATVILAMGAGKTAARAINDYLQTLPKKN